jgi:hypothetical protein
MSKTNEALRTPLPYKTYHEYSGSIVLLKIGKFIIEIPRLKGWIQTLNNLFPFVPTHATHLGGILGSLMVVKGIVSLKFLLVLLPVTLNIPMAGVIVGGLLGALAGFAGAMALKLTLSTVLAFITEMNQTVATRLTFRAMVKRLPQAVGKMVTKPADAVKAFREFGKTAAHKKYGKLVMVDENRKLKKDTTSKMNALHWWSVLILKTVWNTTMFYYLIGLSMAISAATINLPLTLPAILFVSFFVVLKYLRYIADIKTTNGTVTFANSWKGTTITAGVLLGLIALMGKGMLFVSGAYVLPFT